MIQWVQLTPSVLSSRSGAEQEKQLLKAKAVILSPQPSRKTPFPSKYLKQRIDRTYEPYPWKPDSLYAYRTKSGEYLVLAATDVHPVKPQRHYSKQGNRYVRVEMPELFQPYFLLLNYQKQAPPDFAELGTLRPYVRPAIEKERQSCLNAIDQIRTMFESDSTQTLEEFERQNRKHHPNKSDEQFRQRYLEYIDYCKKELRKYSDREKAFERYFYKRFMLDPKDPVPRERVSDLPTTRHFEREMECVTANWETIENCLTLPGLGQEHSRHPRPPRRPELPAPADPGQRPLPAPRPPRTVAFPACRSSPSSSLAFLRDPADPTHRRILLTERFRDALKAKQE